MKKYMLNVLVVILILALLSACGGNNNEQGEGAQVGRAGTLKIGTQTYSEPKIIAEMYRALIEDRTNIDVEIIPDLAASPVVISALNENEIQMASVLFSGEIFNGYFDIEPTKDREEVLKQAQDGFDEHYNFRWFDSFGYENTYGFTVRQGVAEEHNLENVSDLGPIADDLRIGMDTTWLERDNDGYRAFTEHYGFEFGKTYPMEIGLVYEAVANEEVDIVLAYTTDARIKEFNLKVLQDDKQFFPPYDGSPVVKNETLEAYPELEEVVQLLVGEINEEEMVAMNYEVDVNKRNEGEVAEDFLREKGLLD